MTIRDVLKQSFAIMGGRPTNSQGLNRESTAEIADTEKGGKYSKESADYTRDSDYQDYCSDCVFYQSVTTGPPDYDQPSTCEAVHGDIASFATCKLFIDRKKEESFSPSRDVPEVPERD